MIDECLDVSMTQERASLVDRGPRSGLASGRQIQTKPSRLGSGEMPGMGQAGEPAA